MNQLTKNYFTEKSSLYTKKLYRLLDKLDDETSNIQDYELLYKKIEEKVKEKANYCPNQNFKNLVDYFTENDFFNAYRNYDSRIKMGLFFLCEGYQYILDESTNPTLNKKILPRDFKEKFKAEYERLENVMNIYQDEILKKFYDNQEKLEITSLFLLSRCMDFFIKLTAQEWDFIEKYSKLNKSYRNETIQYIIMLIKLNELSIEFNFSQKDYDQKYEDILEEYIAYEEDYENKKTHKASLLAFKTKLINQNNNTFQEIIRNINEQKQYNNSKIDFFVNQLPLLNAIDNDTFDALLYFRQMKRYASNENLANMQAKLILNLYSSQPQK